MEQKLGYSQVSTNSSRRVERRRNSLQKCLQHIYSSAIHFHEAGLPKVILAGEDVQRHVGEDIIRICVLKID